MATAPVAEALSTPMDWESVKAVTMAVLLVAWLALTAMAVIWIGLAIFPIAPPPTCPTGYVYASGEQGNVQINGCVLQSTASQFH